MADSTTLPPRPGAFSEPTATFSDAILRSPGSITEAARGMGAEACFVRGNHLWQGAEGLPEDRGEAALWFEQAALKGHPGGMFAFAESLRWGDGVLRNPARAEVLYRMAAEAGETKAIHWLSHAYAVGDGVERNPGEAAKWQARAGIRNRTWLPWLLLGLALGAWGGIAIWGWRGR